MVDKVNALLETIGGKRQLPEGKKFTDMFSETRDATLSQLQKSENEFKTTFGPLLTDYVDMTKKITKAQQEAGTKKEDLN